jgi:hypothetical protein
MCNFTELELAQAFLLGVAVCQASSNQLFGGQLLVLSLVAREGNQIRKNEGRVMEIAAKR